MTRSARRTSAAGSTTTASLRPGPTAPTPTTPRSFPTGVIVTVEDRHWLVHGPNLLAWTPGGYTDRRVRGDFAAVTVVTPRATVATLAAGYRPVLHSSVPQHSTGESP